MAATARPSPSTSTSPKAPSGRRERKKAATRRSLEQAAVRLAKERGFDNVTVEDIANVADVSKRTFFNYFASKEQAVLGGDPASAETIRRALTDRPSDESALRALEVVLGGLATHYAENRPDWAIRREVIRSDPHLLAASMVAWAELERTLVEAIAARLDLDPDRDLYPGLLVGAAIAAVRLATLRWHTGEGSLEALLAEAFTWLADGLAAPPRRVGKGARREGARREGARRA